MNLEISNLTCGYSKDRPLVRDVSFTLRDGDICCILGRNGVGKSTMFKTLLCLMEPLSGTVRLDGEDITKWPPDKLARHVAYVAQSHTPPFPYLVEEMIMLGRMSHIGVFGKPGREDEEMVEEIIAELGIRHLKGKPYTEISGGERQMVMIGKALAQQPKILVLDEPTANLDYGNKVLVLDCIKSLAERGICTIFTTHDPEQALLLNSETIIIMPGDPALAGHSAVVVTERNLKRAYNATIRVVEIVDDEGHPVRVCLPMLKSRDLFKKERVHTV